MGKVITVWGSPGSGKSMFSCILAKALTRDKRKAIIINAEISVPMLPVWLPEQIIQTNASVGQVLSSVEIDTTLVASHVTVLKSYPFIGLMGYSAGENPLSYPEVKYAMVLQLVNAAAKLVDFVILDCSSSMTNVFTPAAIESGDLVIRLLKSEWRLIIMTKSKKSIVMHGMLLCPLVLGHCAFLRANGSDYRTSPVVAIHQQSGDLVHFETLNSNYFLSMNPFPLAAASPLPTVLAACA